VLVVTNAWSHPERPTWGTFVRNTVDGLLAAGVRSDVLFVRGYRGWHSYLLGGVAMALLPVATRRKYRLVHSHGGETALLARFYHGAPVLATYWGSDILGPQCGGLWYRANCLARSRILRAHSRLFKATITKSEEMERVLPRRSRRRNWVIPDGVDRSQFSPADRDESRRKLGWPLDEVTVIWVGRRDPVKRLGLAEQATALAANEVKGLRLRVLSAVPPAEMPLHYNAADCLIHTSASEGSPNVIKEALACNLPVVATPAGDIAELLAGVTHCGISAPEPELLAREIVRCVAGRPSSNGREKTRHLDLDRTVERTLECYASIGVESGLLRADEGSVTTSESSRS
jgi:teichuronic acid biosynthesis glycosyltransferase TuaC